ncbi:MAG: tRNA dihydrouridine synthase DusB [Smithellaceae bacterium]|nr:tRNA dihydrouridine synthase DusB [Smithellaceae bacterium]
MRIGSLGLSNNVFLAPMAGVTNLPFRLLVRGFGASLAFTEMVSAEGLVRRTERTYHYLDSSTQDKPLGVQLFGADPSVMAAAAKIAAAHGADVIDINMGCPVRKVVKSGAGAALMKDPGKVALIIRAVRRAVSLPLMIKIRSGWSSASRNALDIALIAEDCGADALTIHPRSAEQGFAGKSDWSLIGEIKAKLGIPIVGSGDINDPSDALSMISQTKCDAVMIGRGCLGNPWLVRAIISPVEQEPLIPPDLTEREKVIRNHLAMETAYHGETLGVRNFRKHLLWYTKGLAGGAHFRNAASIVDCKEMLFAMLRDFLDNQRY